ncbi:MAG: hypothetical protein HFI19_13765 [Lachnospiraceae bacterium]|jgi:hypothetical protein|uniref:hypothetical protein n=1 Tax=Candidatus Merdisoma sp. JLR.KK006 TaxID=3112626 RepID=UPI002FEFEFFD|nr:hypothetical protein [Lachnospiraceae bacterium]
MTWEQFEETGAVKDYLSYRESVGRVQSRLDRRGPEAAQAKKETEYGTDNHSDRHDSGSISVQ